MTEGENLHLTDSEQRVLEYILLKPNATAPEIADKLGFAEGTVRGYLTSIYKKHRITGTDTEKKVKLIKWYKDRERRGTPPQNPPQRATEGVSEGRTLYGEVIEPPQILVPPPERQMKDRTLLTVLILGLALVAIAFFAGVNFGSNQSTNPSTSNLISTSTSASDGLDPINLSKGEVNSEIQIPPPGTVISKGRAFTKHGVAIFIKEDINANDYAIGVVISYKNYKKEDFIVRYTLAPITIYDDLGNVYPIDTSRSRVSSLDEVQNSTLDSRDEDKFYIYSEQTLPVEARNLYIHIEMMFDMYDMTWEIPLY